jgi:PAS domain S-box-containing protein
MTAIRLALEVVVWLTICWIGVFYLAFALAYTGRRDVVRSRWFLPFVAFEGISSVLVLTNRFHGLVWTDFAVDPVFGAATVLYTHQPWVFIQFGALLFLTTLGIYVLLDTVLSYGPLYRKQALAIALTPLLPAVAFTVWVFQLGPYPQLNLTPMMFVPHMMLDVYALFSRDMFEFKPTTRRTGERAAVEDLSTPVVIVDLKGRIVTLNDAAQRLFGIDKVTALGETLREQYDGDPIELPGDHQDGTDRTAGQRREFVVTAAPLADAAESRVGYTVEFQDVTTERQRKQRLEVLNRILRHNLRNDLNVVTLYAEELAEQSNEERSEYATRIRSQADGLVELGKKARRATDTLDGEASTQVIELELFLRKSVADLQEQHDDGSVELAIPPGLRIETQPAVLEMVVGSIVENALEYAGPGAAVRIEAEAAPDDRSILLWIHDDGPGLPSHEWDVVASGSETALEHGSGLGLWLVRWGTTVLGGDVDCELSDENGTTISLRLPGRVDDQDAS